MDPLLRKLNLGDESAVAAVGAPEGLGPVLERFAERAAVTQDLTAGASLTRDPSRAITGEGRRRASGGRRPA